MKVISFYTIDTPYENERDQFIQSAKSVGIETHVEGLKSEGSWEKNCQLKPRFIREKLIEFNEPLLWVDIDARFTKKPEHLAGDIALRFNDHAPKGHRCHILSGTLYVKPTPAVFTLLEHWEELCLDSNLWDQELLAKALNHFEGKITPLPPGYCWIYREPPKENETIYITHYQASNMYKERLAENVPLDSRKIQLMTQLGVHDLDESALNAMNDFLDVIKGV